MNRCDEPKIKILQYLNSDLATSEMEEFRVHVDGCAICRTRLDREQSLSRLLQESRPLYRAPADLRARVSAAVLQHSSRPDRSRLSQSICHALLWQFPSRLRLPGWKILLPTALAISLCFMSIPGAIQRVRAASYVQAAVATHHSYLDGSQTLGIQSQSPEAVTAWFAGKVPFQFRLPASQAVPDGRQVYKITGARLVKFNSSDAALVTYETQNEKISLLVASSRQAVVAGGDEVQFGDLIFHYLREGPFKVITWSNHGLSYALVLSISGSARESCMVCHQNMQDRDGFRSHP
jgi:anti-sigma factor (TIGR02949 family)